MFTPLSEVLSSEADQVIIDADQPIPEAETDTSQESQQATETVETSETAETPETQEAAPTAETTQSNPEMKGIMSAMMDERSKRQALEAQIKTMQADQVEKPDAFVNPDEAIQFGNDELRNDFNNKFLNMSESQARSRHGDDFDTMKDLFFNEMAIDNPALAQQAQNAPDPFEFIYQQAKTHNEFKGINSMDDYKAKVKAELRVELEAEYADKAINATNDAINSALSTVSASKHTDKYGIFCILDALFKLVTSTDSPAINLISYFVRVSFMPSNGV